jgi:uncharacterized protein
VEPETMTLKRTSSLRTVMVVAALFLPVISLIPLGSIWLWQQGYLLYWIGAAFVISSSCFLLESWLVRRANPASPAANASALATGSEASWTPREQLAWDAVEALATATDPTQLTSREALLDLGVRTIETVARNIHPGDKDPLWRFTVPEALALVERVSRDLRPLVADHIPLGDQLTVGQVMKVYRWRSALDVAEKAYDLWRVVRLLNPVTAVANEARERLTKKLYSGVRDQFARRLTEGYIREIGRAAIDLYGGRLRVSANDLAEHVSQATERDAASMLIAEPLRLLVAGQISVGKSSLINALLRDVNAAVDIVPTTAGFTTYKLTHDTLPSVLLIDSPGIQTSDAALRKLATEAGACDLVIWVVAANRADRQLDRLALDAVRSYFATTQDRRMPPIIAVATHIDVLRPVQEWAPPYDIANPVNDKTRSIRAALDHIAVDLDLNIGDVIPTCLADKRPAYNVDGIWTKIAAVLPEARSAHLVRRLRSATTGWKWSKLWSQTVNAGKALQNRSKS